MKRLLLFDTTLFSFAQHHWLTIAFLLGFVTDFLLLNRIDDTFDNSVLFFYVMLASVSLLLFYVGVSEKVSGTIGAFLRKGMPILMQYSFGGLLSGMLIFYGRSGDLFVNAPFLLLIIGVIIANELVKKRSNRLLYNLVVYFIGLLSYLVLIVPVMIGEMGDVIFVGSGVLALVCMYFLLKILGYIIPHYLVLEKRYIVFTIGSLYAFFNVLYFLNMIPPIPLSLTELSVYQEVERTATGGYRITKEHQPWWRGQFSVLPPVFHPSTAGVAYCFARVYAPTSLKTEIVHRWEYYNETEGWITRFTQPYTVSWENKNGYRGYTMTKNLVEGKWRCGVETVRGQVLGRMTFIVDSSTESTSLVTVVE